MFLTLKDEQNEPSNSGINIPDGAEYVQEIPISEISDFPDHPFKVRQDEAMLNMTESIRENGVRQPAIVRPMPDGGYQKISKPQQDKSKIKEKIRRLNVVYMAGGKSDDEYQVEMAELNKLLRLAEQEEPETTPKDLSSLKEFLDNGLNRELYDSLTQAEKRLLWRSLIDEIHFEGINVKDIKFKHAPALKVAVNQ